MHRIHIQFAADKKLSPPINKIKQWALLALQEVKEKTEVTIRIVDEAEISELNERYRQKPKPTNVLSFPAEEIPGIKEPRRYLGDILICPAVVNREAIEQEKSQTDHWAHIVMHGLLHLLGYDHISDEDAEEMESLEKKLLKQINIADPYQ